MAYVDKCCDICDEYVMLKRLNPRKYQKWSSISRDYYDTFSYWAPVDEERPAICDDCFRRKPLEWVSIEELTLHIEYTRRNLNKKWYYFVDPDTGKCWKDNGRWLPEYARYGIKHPYSYEVTGPNINGTAWFSAGGIQSHDKRKLRRILRKLGLKGKINEFIS